MKGDLHVRFWEELRGKFPRLTRLKFLNSMSVTIYLNAD